MVPRSGRENGCAGAAPRSPRTASHRSHGPRARRPTHGWAAPASPERRRETAVGRRADRARRAADRIAPRSPERHRRDEAHGNQRTTLARDNEHLSRPSFEPSRCDSGMRQQTVTCRGIVEQQAAASGRPRAQGLFLTVTPVGTGPESPSQTWPPGRDQPIATPPRLRLSRLGEFSPLPSGAALPGHQGGRHGSLAKFVRTMPPASHGAP